MSFINSPFLSESEILPWEPSFILREQSRVWGHRTWLVRAPLAAVSSIWKACPLGNEADTSLNHTQPVDLVSPHQQPNPFSLHQTLFHRWPPYTSASTPLCNAEFEREKENKVACGFGPWHDGRVWQAFIKVETKRKEETEHKGSKPSMMWTLDEAFCVRKMTVFKEEDQRRDFGAAWRKHTDWLREGELICMECMEIWWIFFFPSQQSLRDKSPGKGAVGV